MTIEKIPTKGIYWIENREVIWCRDERHLKRPSNIIKWKPTPKEDAKEEE